MGGHNGGARSIEKRKLLPNLRRNLIRLSLGRPSHWLAATATANANANAEATITATATPTAGGQSWMGATVGQVERRNENLISLR